MSESGVIPPPEDRTRAKQTKDVVSSFRLPADLVAALRQRADENGETLSDVLRRGCLLVLGICPTCERPVTREASVPP